MVIPKIKFSLITCVYVMLTQTTPNYRKVIPTQVFPLQTDGNCAGYEGIGEQLREELWLCQVVRLGGAARSVPARRAGDLGSNPDPGKNFSLKLATTQEIVDV